jgi:hypothetical protein
MNTAGLGLDRARRKDAIEKLGAFKDRNVKN